MAVGSTYCTRTTKHRRPRCRRVNQPRRKARRCMPRAGPARRRGITMKAKLRVIHVINSFEPGGAEAMLCNLLLRSDRGRFDGSVASLIDDLNVAGPVLEAGIPVATMGM